jgi:competence protein ComGC
MNENSAKSNVLRNLLKFVIFLGILGLFALIAIPNYFRARTGMPYNPCIAVLRQIDNAKQQWALDNNKADTNEVTWNDIRPFLGRGNQDSLTVIFCPQDKTRQYSNSYTLENVKTKPKCKINPATHFIN